MTPVNASKKANENKVFRILYPIEERRKEKPKFSVGDRVRISRKKKPLRKGTPRDGPKKIFTISEVKLTSPVTYKIADLNGEEIRGTLYETELQKAEQELFRVERVIEKGKKKSLVKWKGYSDEFNSWVDNKDIINI